MNDDDPTDAELAEAEALARALDRGTATAELVEEDFETAALLRYSGPDGELGERRSAEILNEVLGSAKAPAVAPSRSSSWLKWLFLPASGVGIAAAAALLLTFVSSSEPAPEMAEGGDTASAEVVSPSAQLADAMTALPRPSASLLAAQAEAAGGSDAAHAALGNEMGSYRGELFAALSHNYGGR